MASVDRAQRLVIGVTGHRDLCAEELPALRERFTSLLIDLRDRFPDLAIEVVTSVAAGADQLALDVADRLGLDTLVLLPMPLDAMSADFEPAAFRSAAAMLEGRRVACLSTRAQAADDVDGRSLQYEYLGVYLAAHCHLLVAIWDGQPSQLLGGTAQVVDFHLNGNTRIEGRSAVRSPIDFTEDESDLVYHIRCSRTDGETVASPGSAGWLTRDPADETLTDLPERYARTFSRQAELARELGAAEMPLADAVDTLALRYQKSTVKALFVTFALAGGAATSFVVYADLNAHPLALLAYGALMLGAIGAQQLARWRGWHRKYVDYRGLAEALRTVTFWCRAGVRPLEQSTFAHDHFLRRQELELGWIRNVLRGVGLSADVSAQESPEELHLVCQEWVADQTTYYQRARDRLARRSRTLGRVSTACFVLGLVAVGAIALRSALGTAENELLIALMGVLPMTAALLANYVYRLSLREDVAQFSYMARILGNAQGALAVADDDERRRAVLFALGEAAFDENGLWLQRRRERPISDGGVAL